MPVGTVHRLPSPAAGGPTIGAAVAGFLAGFANPNTARSSGIATCALVTEFGADTPLAVLDTEDGTDRVAAWFTARWGTAAPSTANVRLDALRSAAAWWRDQQWLTGKLTRRIRRRGRPQDRARSIPRDDLERFLAADKHPLRDRLLCGCSTSPRPGPRRSWPSTSPTSTGPTGAPRTAARATPTTSSPGAPASPGCCPATSRAASTGR